ncbi:MAG TPA: PQQ-binding-like beta-propeller repeat protein, partial [Planctomycetota bacterium]|nr:PQQ-binding-like beta-propeller repeat protein [Planctomycetota bacterium]
VVLDRKTGKPLWSATAVHGWRHNAICAGDGRLYAVDRLSGLQEERLKRADQPAGPPPRLVAFDLRTGKELWSTSDGVFGTWLSYSEEHDVLVEAGRVARDTMTDEAKGMRARKGSDGRAIWTDEKRLGPAMILGRTIHMVGRACDLLTGKPVLRAHPITEQDVEWTWTRTYGCNTPMLSTHLLTFRSGAAGYFDLANDGGTGNFGGFRSSCTNNLVVAGGILTAPDYTRTCTCGYQNQTSIALVPMPEAEMWTFYGSTDLKGAVRRLGVNLGAPGDRVDGKTLWLEHPSVGGKSPAAPVKLGGTPEYFRRHASRVKGPLPWVAASGARNVSSVTVTLDKSAKERAYRVRLVFVDPGGTAPFDVSLQGKTAIEKLAFEAPWTSVVREFQGVRAGKELRIDLSPPGVLSGLEIVCEESLAPEDKLAVVLADPGEDNEVLYFPRADGSDDESEDDEIPAEPFFWVAGALSALVVILLVVRMRGGRA